MTTPLSTSEPNRLREELGENSSSLERALLPSGIVVRELAADAREGAGGAGSRRGIDGVVHRVGGGRIGGGIDGGEADLDQAAARCFAGRRRRRVPVGYYALHSAAPGGHARAARGGVGAGRGRTGCPLPRPAATPAAALLTEELGALDHARLALVNGEGRRTLDELDAYDRRFPGGRLQIEAEVLRIDALAKLGRKEAARQRAEAFLRRHPNSVLATRVRAHVAD